MIIEFRFNSKSSAYWVKKKMSKDLEPRKHILIGKDKIMTGKHISCKCVECYKEYEDNFEICEECGGKTCGLNN